MPAKKGVLGWIRDQVVVEVPDDDSSKKSQPLKNEGHVPVVRSSISSASVSTVSGANADQFREVFLGNLKNDSTEAFFQFQETLKAMKEAIPDETSAFKAAAISLKKTGSDAPAIIQAGTHVLESLDFEKDRGLKELNDECKSLIAGKEGEQEEAISSISSMEQQIAELGAKLEELKKQKTAIGDDIAESKHKFEGLQTGLNLAYTALKEELRSTNEKIKQFCK